MQGFTSPVPPVEYQKSVDTGPCDDEVTHEPLANVRLAELTGESNAAALEQAGQVTWARTADELPRVLGEALARQPERDTVRSSARRDLVDVLFPERVPVVA